MKIGWKSVLCLLIGVVLWGRVCAQQTNVQSVALRASISPGQSGPDWYGELRNIRRIHPHGLPPALQAFQAAKEDANARYRDYLAHSSGSPESPSGLETTTLVQDLNYEGNRITGTPNDNELAISKGGKIVSVANVNIEMFNASSSTPVVDQSLAAFAGLPGGSLLFDPRVTYDPDSDRFIVVFLEGNAPGESYLHIGFSGNSDPFGNWNFYKLAATNQGRWADFPSLSVGTDEVLVTTNLVSGSASTNSSQIFQIGKYEGYAGQALVFATYFSQDIGWHAVRGGNRNYGPDMWIVRTFMNVFSGSIKLFFRKLTAPLSGGGSLSGEYSLNLNLPYSLPPDVSQKGSSTHLATNGFGVLSAIQVENRIYLGLNSGDSLSRPSLYFARVNLAPQNSGFINAFGWTLNPAGVEAAYPSLAYLGREKSGEELLALGFNFAGPDQYPGNGCVLVNDQGEIGPILKLKEGNGPMGGSGTVSRWGDYTGMAQRYNNPGEVWFVGSYGQTGSLTKGTWISQLRTGATPPVGRDETEDVSALRVYPVPARELTRIEFEVRESGSYRVHIRDAAGRTVETFGERSLSRGTARFSFNAASLAAGVYLISLEGPAGRSLIRKITVD